MNLQLESADKELSIASNAADPEFDGIGGVIDTGALLHAYPEPQRGQILDYVFKPNYGQAMQVFKIDIGGDGNVTSGSESAYKHAEDGPENIFNGYQTWLAMEAAKRNPDIKIRALQWAAPGWTGGICTQKNADYLARWAQQMKEKTGIAVEYLATSQNERFCPRSKDPSKPDLMTDEEYFPALRKTLDANGLKSIKLAGYDVTNPPNPEKLAPAVIESLQAISEHYPHGWQEELDWQNGADPTMAAWAKRGVKIWAGEDSDFQALKLPGKLTRLYNFRYLQDGLTSVIVWTGLGATYGNFDHLDKSSNNKPAQMPIYATQPWSGNYYLVEPVFWSMAHTTQFTKPGWRFVKDASSRLPNGGSIVSYRSNRGNPQEWSAVVETIDATKDQTIRLNVPKDMVDRRITIFTTHHDGTNTEATHYFSKLDTFNYEKTGGKIEFRVKPNSLITLTSTSGQAKGTAHLSAPKPAPFPAEYREDFERFKAGESTDYGYLVAGDGAYEVQPCRAGRTGKCLAQLTPAAPIVWEGGNWGADAMAGDATISNYIVSANVLLDANKTDAEAGIFARHRYGRSSKPSLRLVLKQDGTWRLTGVRDGSKTGTYTAPGQWHGLKLEVKDDLATASIDGQQVAQAAVWTGVGQAGIYSNYSFDQYDDFALVVTK